MGNPEPNPVFRKQENTNKKRIGAEMFAFDCID